MLERACEFESRQEYSLDALTQAFYCVYQMSTKVMEDCPKCGTCVTPTDDVMGVDVGGRDVPIRMWRYECTKCVHVWSNAAQREHNATALRAARRWERAGLYGG